MIKINKIPVKSAYYGNDDLSRIYMGEDLVWQREEKKSNIISGKFTDNSREDDWYYHANGSNDDNDIVSIAKYVNPETKEFSLNFDLENVTTMENMFHSCMSLQTMNLDDLGCGNVTNMSLMFFNCVNLQTLHCDNWDCSKVTTMSNMFYNCKNLQTLHCEGWDCGEVNNMYSMFGSCTNLQTLNLAGWGCGNVTNLGAFLSNCTSLQTLNLDGWDFGNVTSTAGMFNNCNNLQNIIGKVKNIKVNIMLGSTKYGMSLSNESAMVFINGLAIVEEPKSITFHRDCYDTLTEDQIAIATDKGWTVVRA